MTDGLRVSHIDKQTKHETKIMARHPDTEGNDLEPKRVDAKETVTVPDGQGGRLSLSGDAQLSAGTLIPTGLISMWSGQIGDIPDGWTLCDGTDGTPDLQDRFIVGAGNQYTVDQTGGKETIDTSHTHPEGDNQDADSGPNVDPVTSIGTAGDTDQENRPPFYALAYIMKT